MGCESLASIEISNTVTEIGKSAFDACEKLSSIVIPKYVEFIEESTFEDCTSLTSVVIPSAVKRIDYYAFRGCKNISEIILLKTYPPTIVDATDDHEYVDETFDVVVKQECILKVPIGTAEEYRKAPGWREFQNIVEFDGNKDSVQDILIDAENTSTQRYNLKGQPVDEEYRGVYVKGGKKYLRK